MRSRLFAAGLLLAISNWMVLSPASGQVGVWFYNTPGTEPSNVVKLRFRFSVGQNEGSINASPKIKLILGTIRVWGGSGGPTYILEANLYTSKWQYEDPACPPPGPPAGLQGEEVYDQASLRMAIPDYVGEGKTGCRTFSPEMFPRQTYEIDYIQGLFKTDMMSQTNLNGECGLVEIERGPLVSDKSGWKCSQDLSAGTEFRQWDVHVTIGGVRHAMAFAVPNENGRYLYPLEMPSLTTEFFANIGLFQVFYWEFAYQREGETNWSAMPRWKLRRDDGLSGRPYGVRVVQIGSRNVLEVSNTGGSPPYIGLNTVFDLPFDKPVLSIRSEPPDVVLSWSTNHPGYVVNECTSLASAVWGPLTNSPPSALLSCIVTSRPVDVVSFFRLALP